MRAYQVEGFRFDPPEREVIYCGTLKDAKSLVQAHIKRHPQDRAELTVLEVEVHVNKRTVLRMINDEGGFVVGTGRIWGVGPRGGLREEPRGSA